MGTAIQSAIEEIDQIPDHRLCGRVDSVLGLAVEVAGPADGYAHAAQGLGMPDTSPKSPGAVPEADPAKEQQS